MDTIFALLKEYGLDENEIKIYLCLVGNKRLSAYAIAKTAKIHKSTCYDVLERLIEKGFVAQTNHDKKKLYSANGIDNVLGRVKNKESILLSLKPEIEKIELKEETYARYSDAKNSFAEFDVKLFNLAKNHKLTFFYMIGNSPDLTTQSSRLLIERLLKELFKENILKYIDGRAIWDARFRTSGFMKQFGGKAMNRFLDNIPSKSTLFIYDSHIAFVSLSDVEKVIEIKDNAATNEMKAYFEHLWKLAKK